MRASSASSITGILDETVVQLARVVGTVVATQKHRTFEGAKLLLVQPLNLDETPRGSALLAVDGVGEEVFFVRGREAAFPFHPAEPPVDASIVGIVDQWDLET